MIVVSNTSPLNYLVLIRQDQILPALFGQVFSPPTVIEELSHTKAPKRVRNWIAGTPTWLEIREPQIRLGAEFLDRGESDAIALAEELSADALLMDERQGTRFARERGIEVLGTLGVLEVAARRNLVNLPTAIQLLRKTTFHAPEQLSSKFSTILSCGATQILTPRDCGFNGKTRLPVESSG